MFQQSSNLVIAGALQRGFPAHTQLLVLLMRLLLPMLLLLMLPMVVVMHTDPTQPHHGLNRGREVHGNVKHIACSETP